MKHEHIHLQPEHSPLVIFCCPLGDGLMFELENGKPKLVLASYDESRTASKVGHSQVSHKNKAQKSTVPSKQCPKEPERPLKERKSGAATPAATNHVERLPAHTSRKTKVKVSKDHRNVIGVVRVQSESKTKTTDESSRVTEKTVKESLVCLTQEQLQQILNSIKTSGQNVQEDSKSTTHVKNGGLGAKEEHASSDPVSSGAAELLLDSSNHRHRTVQERGGDDKKPLNSTAGSGLFSTLGEREREREALEAKRAQWRRELDEQMALKKQQKVKTGSTLQSEPSEGPRSSDQPSAVQDDRVTRTSTNGNPASSQTHSSQRNLPSATHSAFILGEATPLENAFTEEKKHQQRRWLQDLEQQREEAKLRKKLEKQSQNQTEDHERWAMHFESFQRRLVPQPPTASPSERGEMDVGSSLSHHRSPSGVLSTAWENMSTFGGDQKSSYLRTMTALLDPSQIEERERKRIKQLEHQRAIEAQVEERRRQKEREEAERRAQELEEERKVARERELLQQQYLMDTQRQRQKEDLQSRKAEELYLSVQRAQEEAQKDRHQQRIRDLARKGHDVSNLLRRLEPAPPAQPVSGSSLGGVATEDPAQRVEAPGTARRDMAVQTEVSEVSSAGSGMADMGVHPSSDHRAPSAPAPPNLKRSRRDVRLSERNGGKENVFLALKEADPYEAYARTDRPHPQQPGRKPEWNTHRPSKPFIPASERYPSGLQRHRQESRMRRQMELLTLVERNTFSRTSQQQDPPTHSVNPSHPPLPQDPAHRKGEDPQRRPSTSNTGHSRGPSPPVPALKHRPQQIQQPEDPEGASEITDWPPSSDYIPYVRTDEVYHLDPLAPISRPTTREAPPRTHADVIGSRQPTPVVQRDPLLHPELLKSTERQQAILKGLSELRQGLLQKQRELESSLNPLLAGQSRTHSPAFQPM
ncbi:coiled-coil domain-containing protein 66 isoform X3 [Astyanax mexicanus]|uniref:Coiled-coil domain-containing protein 66 isoform X3 n=1 Tax=Astyanax mexicanus TaxID=7994 RepID=A0A8T2KLG9_ASTMX|nr:coiled-coil domain-containing protein 66 isoform X3 [Astyanax mexicanus]